MMNAKTNQIGLLVCLGIVEAVLGTLIVGHFTNFGEMLEFIAILIFPIFLLFFAPKGFHKQFQCVAFVFTLLADAGLVLNLYNNKVLSVAIFCLAQICYLTIILFYQRNSKIKILNLIIFVVIASTLESLALLVLKANFDFLVFFTLLYLSLSLTNIIFSGINVKQNKFLFVGLILFLCCDLIIGFGSAGGYFDFSSIPFIHSILNAPFDIATSFYILSQYFLFLSVFKIKSANQKELIIAVK
ncbi:MAG: lysoplasmalogenase family protein [Clostridia bacterium]